MNRRQALGLLAAAAGRGGAPWGGTFLQFWAGHRDWDEARWQRLFGYLEALRARELVVQWSGWDGIDYGGLTERVLEMAGGRGMRVRVGLRHESRWWKDVETEPGKALSRLERRTAELDRPFLRGMERKRAFAGWYLPEEIGQAQWRGAEGRALADCVRDVKKQVGRLAVSGFPNPEAAPQELGRFWGALARRSGVEEVLFQDGIGAGKATLETWPSQAAALRRELGRKLRVVVETFEASGEAGGFRARPAPVGRVLEQARVARRYSREAPVAFSLPEYCTPEGGAEAADRYGEYLASMDRI